MNRRILYITNAPIPANRKTDAHFQELDLLSSRFHGQVISAFPGIKPWSGWPRIFYGMFHPALKEAIESADLIHVFSSVLANYPYFRHFSQKSVVYTCLTSVSRLVDIRGVDRLIVHDPESASHLRANGYEDVDISPPWVDYRQELSPPPTGPFTLLMASAPWEKKQFDSKGIYFLLDMLDRIPDLQLVFIWRNIHYDKMRSLVQRSKHTDRIRLVNEVVDIRQHMHIAHAVVLLASHSSLVKSYPHSLLEGLLSGRPVLTSATIPISTLIQQNDYGVVCPSWGPDQLEKSIRQLMSSYDHYVSCTTKISPERFGSQSFVEFHEKIYKKMGYK